MNTCRVCGVRIPAQFSGRTREYCGDKHRLMAGYIRRATADQILTLRHDLTTKASV